MAQKDVNVALPELQGPFKDSYCRLCLIPTAQNEFKDLFTPFNSMQSIAETIEDFAKVEILKTDDYSKLICVKCFDRLTATEEFRSQIENADFRMKNQFRGKDLIESDSSDDGSYEMSGGEDSETEKIIIQGPELDIKVEPNPLTNFNKDKAKDEEDVDKEEEESSKEIRKVGKKKVPKMELVKVENGQKIKKKRIKKKVLLKCPDCDKVFRSYEGRKAHSYTHSGEYRFYCSFCKKGFGKKGAHEAHEATHRDITPHQCEICGKGFKTAPGLLNHKTVHAETKSFNCDQCDKSFRSKIRLSAHYGIHSTKYAYVCEICNLAFKTISGKSTHFRRAHKPQRTVPCDICSKLVPNLTIHMRTHTKPYVCHICNLSFGNKTVLTRHVNIHTGEKTYICNVCQKVFNHPSSLRNHKLIHENVKRFKCELCDKKFVFKHHYQGHMKNNHQQDSVM